MDIANLKWGDWVLRQDRRFGGVTAMRAGDAINELAKILPASEYPSRLSIAEAIASGDTLATPRYEYRLDPPDTEDN